MQNIVVIDDIETQLKTLADGLHRVFRDGDVEIRTWVPGAEAKDSDPQARFDKLVDADTLLVITDYDLTGKGQTGLFGSTIVNWCQTRVVPVGDFSRGQRSALPKEPNLYEIRIPTEPEEAAVYIAGVYRGFNDIRVALEQNSNLLKRKSPIGVLVEILGRIHEESRFTLYGARMGTANAALVEKIMSAAPEEVEPTETDKRRLLTYVIGHLLLNIILRFPGPLLNRRTLAAYFAVSEMETSKIEAVFSESLYRGPFSDIGPYYWLSDIDNLLMKFGNDLSLQSNAETQGELNRSVVEMKLGHNLARHECKRCNGQNGGFLCPFTQKTVCQLPTCSVGSSGWIPTGARLCRVEKEFYEEWSPILGF